MGASGSVFDRYPQLTTLRGKVPDDTIEREVGPKAVEFESYRLRAEQRIPTARLCDVFPAELEMGKITLEHFLGQWGNISVEELCKICLIAAWLKPQGIFEFGTYNGMTTLQLALNSPPNCRIYTLDVSPEVPLNLDIGEIDRHLAQKVGVFHFDVGHYFQGSACESKITQIWGDSTQVDLSEYNGRMDLVFVDAGHTYTYVKSDTQKAFQMVRAGGVVVWHDYLQVLHPDVTKYLGELSENYRIYHLRGTNLALLRVAGE
jgi:predicted O-methyltransferase YrrM